MYNRNFNRNRGGNFSGNRAPFQGTHNAGPSTSPPGEFVFGRPDHYGMPDAGLTPILQWNQQPSTCINFSPGGVNPYTPNRLNMNPVSGSYSSPNGNTNFGRRRRSSEQTGYPLVTPRKNFKRSHQTEDDGEPTQKKQRSDGRSSASLVHVAMNSGVNDKITEGVWKYFENFRQTDEDYRAKVNLRDALYVIFREVFPFSGLYMVGSSMSGFGSKTSDMDLCLMLSHDQIEGKREAVEILTAIQRCLRRGGFIKRSQVIRARVPILKFEDYLSGVECDLNINNSVGIRNTHLLRYYAAMDWRVRPLVLFVKRWARFHDINDASKKTISSYSLCLMVIHYLQFGCNPAVLESVQKLYPDLFDYGDDIRNLKMNVKIEFRSKNCDSLGTLFLGFLKYYATEFDFDVDVISVRQGMKLPIHLVQSWTQPSEMSMWKCLKIEEPFDKSNTARSCFDERTFERVIHVFTRSYRQLAKTRKLESILTAPF